MNSERSAAEATLTPVSPAIGGWADFLYRYGPYLAFAQALIAMLGSLYFSEVAGFVPCTLCWYQRILMYPLTIIILVGIIKQDEYLPGYVLPFSIIGLFVSLYHYLLQTTTLFSGSAFCKAGIPCNIRYINWFGFVTIPFLALTAFTVITIIMLATRWANQRVEASSK